MAEVSYTDGITPPKENIGPRETIPQTNPSMMEQVEVRTTATTGMEAISPQMLATQASTEEMPAPAAFAPRDLAMEYNLMTTAEAPSIEHGASNTVPSAAGVAAEHSTASVTAAGAETSSGYAVPLVPAAGVENPSRHSDAHGHATELPHQRDTSATGWQVPPAATPISKITFDDYLTLSEITFEWGDSYDCKDWMRLGAILAPHLMVDYTEVNGHKWDSMPASDFVGILSHIGFVGDPLVHTQHHIGASKWQKISSEEVIGHHQLRAAHQRYTNLDLNVVENKGHGHAMVKHYYRKVNGEWKLAGLRPAVRWNEFEFDKGLRGSR